MRASLLFGLSVGLVLGAGCDSVGTDGPCPTCGGGDSGASFISVDPRQTYLRTSNDNAVDAPAVRLSDYGAEPGERVCGVALGNFDTGGGTLIRSTGSPLVTAVFSADARLLEADTLARVPGAIDVGRNVLTAVTVIGGLPTDIAEDFNASRSCITIPAGAAFVFFSAYDGFFADNVDVVPGGQVFGIQIEGGD